MTKARPGVVAEQLLTCARCRHPWSDLRDGETRSCRQCGLTGSWSPPCFRYDFDALLRSLNERAWLRHKVLQNNGYISYVFLQEGSLSLPDRPDVRTFGAFIAKNTLPASTSTPAPVLLDVGSGTLPLPGYLVPVQHHFLIGLDPFPSNEFPGLMIIGCCEFLPLADNAVDAVVFGTSFDHLMDYNQSLDEVWRVLKPGGRVLIWMSDRSAYVTQRASLRDFGGWRRKVRYVRQLLARLWERDPLSSVDPDRFFVYPNNTVLPIPDGAVDPFHTVDEHPAWVKDLFFKRGFSLLDEANHNANLVLLAFEKSA